MDPDPSECMGPLSYFLDNILDLETSYTDNLLEFRYKLRPFRNQFFILLQRYFTDSLTDHVTIKLMLSRLFDFQVLRDDDLLNIDNPYST